MILKKKMRHDLGDSNAKLGEAISVFQTKCESDPVKGSGLHSVIFGVQYTLHGDIKRESFSSSI